MTYWAKIALPFDPYSTALATRTPSLHEQIQIYEEVGSQHLLEMPKPARPVEA